MVKSLTLEELSANAEQLLRAVGVRRVQEVSAAAAVDSSALTPKQRQYT
jgi:hypothetical protein